MDYDSIDGVDRISGLPDHILCYILSFLPTKDAVVTSVLSTRWKYLWTCVPVLDFDARLHEGTSTVVDQNSRRGSHIAFKNFVSRVLLLNDTRHVQKLRLIYMYHKSHTPIRTWLHLAISSHIQELELDFSISVEDNYFKLPRKIFMSSSLVVLKLSRLPLKIPSFVCFPMLKILELRCVVGLDDKSVDNLLSGCQVLEELVIEEFIREKPRVINISIQTLKCFLLSYRYVIDITADFSYKFIINTPNLEIFHIKGRISDDFVVENMATLVNAHLDLRKPVILNVDSHSRERVCNLIEGITNANFISLSNDIVELAIGIGVDISWTRLVTKFMNCSPNLEILTLNNKQVIIRDIEQWLKNPPLPVPQYVLSQIKDILIQEIYSSFEPEAVDVVEGLLRDVNLLKRLKINCQCPFMLVLQIRRALY